MEKYNDKSEMTTEESRRIWESFGRIATEEVGEYGDSKFSAYLISRLGNTTLPERVGPENITIRGFRGPVREILRGFYADYQRSLFA